MSFRISKEETDEIIRLWQEGKSFPQINKLTGRSLERIHSIIKDLKEKNPDIDTVRDVITKVTTAKKTVPDLLRTLNILDNLEKVEVTSDGIAQCWDLLRKYGEDTDLVLEAGVRIDDLQKRTGLDYNEIERRYNSWEQTKSAIVEDEKRKKALESEIERLEDLGKLQSELKANRIGPDVLTDFIEFQKTLRSLKFDREAANLLANELAKIGLSVLSGAKEIAGMIQQYGSMAEAIEARRSDLAEIHNLKISAEKDLNSFKGQTLEAKRLLSNEQSALLALKKSSDDVFAEKKGLEVDISNLEVTRDAKKEEIVLADSVMTLITNHAGLSMEQVKFLSDKMNRAKMDREKELFRSSDREIDLAILVISQYLHPRLIQMIADVRKSKDALEISYNDALKNYQVLSREMKRREKTLEKMDSFFTNIEIRQPFTEQLGYSCPHCEAQIFLLKMNTKASIKVTCGNCKKPSTPGLLEFYQIVLKYE